MQKLTISLFVVLCILGLISNTQAQEAVTGPYTGKVNFSIGDKVEATYAGSWYPAEVVGTYDPESQTYQIHFEGEKYCSNHRLDSRINKQWVRPPKAAPMLAGNETNQSRGAADKAAPAEPVVSSSSGGSLPVGMSVKYAGAGVLWSPGAKIEKYDAAKRQYTVRLDGGSGDIVPCYAVHRVGGAVDNSFFVGDWEVRINGATTTFVKGNDLYRRVSGGMKLPPLQIKADGTYTWIDMDGKVLNGAWNPRPEGVPGIVIKNGLDGMDWTVYEKTEGYSPTEKTRDEIGFHHIPSATGYYSAYRIGANKSCTLVNRAFKK